MTNVTNKLKLTLVNFITILFVFGFYSCEDDDDAQTPIVNPPVVSVPYQATINFKHMVNDQVLQMNLANKPYTNKMGQKFNVDRLRYLISDIEFVKADGNSFLIDEYHFVDATIDSTLTFTPNTKVPSGIYTSIRFKFGFDTTDNIDRAYPELTIANWDWPAMLGGGYHFMQLEGKYEDSTGAEQVYKTHMGTARDMSTTPPTFEDNHFMAKPSASSIGITSDFSFDIVMNIEQWYEDPVEWDFHKWNFPVMPIYEAQRALNQNGPSVFSIKNQ